MNTTELRTVLRKFLKVSPAFMKWRTDNANSSARVHGTTPEQEWEEQLESWARTLQSVTEAEGVAVVERMETGNIPAPRYGEIAQVIRRYAMLARQNDTHQYDLQKSFRCLACLDTGMANVWNPNFVESYEPIFKGVQREEIDRTRNAFNLDKYDPDRMVAAHKYDPPDWVAMARRWWRGMESSEGPIYHVALCNCDSPRTIILKRELDEYNAGRRKTSSGKKAGLPACGAATYNPEVMPLRTSVPYDDLFHWYQRRGSNANRSAETKHHRA